MTVEEALHDPTINLEVWAELMGWSRSATYSAARRGEIEGLIKLGRTYRVASATVRRQLGLPERGAA